MANREVKIDHQMVQKAPPVHVSEKYKPIMANIAIVLNEASGESYRIARFDSKSGAYNRAAVLRRNPDFVRLEFKGVSVDDTDPGYAEGWRSELYCKWIGVPGNPGYTPPDLRGIKGGRSSGDDDDNDGATPKKRGRPKAQS